MEISQLKYFYTAAKYEHITRAAEELHVAQPALTQSIHRLEDELDTELFIRVGRRIELSKSGRFLMERLEPVLSTLDTLKDDIAELSKKESTIIRLNVREASALVAHAITDYQNKHNDAVFKVASSSTDENSDIYIDESRFFTPTKGSKIFSVSEKILLAVSKNSRYAEMDSVNISDIMNERFAARSINTKFRKSCETICQKIGFSPNIAFDCEEPAMVMHLVGKGICVAFYPEYSFNPVKHTDIILKPINSPEFYLDLVVSNKNPQNKENKSVNDFYEFLINYFSNTSSMTE